jgi:hypothetical protein
MKSKNDPTYIASGNNMQLEYVVGIHKINYYIAMPHQWNYRTRRRDILSYLLMTP